MIASGVQAGLLTDLVGYCYPAYMSLCSVGRVGKEIEALWWVYWCVWGDREKADRGRVAMAKSSLLTELALGALHCEMT